MSWESSHTLRRVRLVALLATAFALAFTALAFAMLSISPQHALAEQSNGLHRVGNATYFYANGSPVKNTWKTVGKHKYYFGKDGKALTGPAKAGKTWYCFNDKGVMQTGSAKKLTQSRKVKMGAWTYYLTNSYELEARQKGSTYYYNNGDKMTKADKKDYTTWIIAQGIASKVTKKGDSRKTKRLKVFKWVMKKYYVMHRNFKQNPDWPAVYAMDHFNNKGGDCNSDGAAFTYLAAAIGDRAYVCLSTTRSVNAAHAWCEINGREYDPLFAQAKSFSTYYGGKKSRPLVKIKIPYFDPKHVKGQGKVPGRIKRSKASGLVKSKGIVRYYKRGKAVKSQWVTVKGKRYYFNASGKAVRGSVKVKTSNGSKKKAYFVFGENCVLKTGKKTRVVNVNKAKYRVGKNGRALAGWSGKSYSFANGELASGPCKIKGAYYLFDSKGNYDATSTAQLRRVLKVGANFANAKALLGKPVKATTASSCRASFSSEDGAIAGEGTDGMLTYPHLVVTTYAAPKSSTTYIATIDAR